MPRTRPPQHNDQGTQEGQVGHRGGLQSRIRGRRDQGGGDVEAEGFRREVVQDLPFPDGVSDDAEPVHVPRLPLSDTQVDIHLERDRVVQRQDEGEAQEEGHDELPGEPGVLHDADIAGLQQALAAAALHGRDDGRGTGPVRAGKMNSRSLLPRRE